MYVGEEGGVCEGHVRKAVLNVVIVYIDTAHILAHTTCMPQITHNKHMHTYRTHTHTLTLIISPMALFAAGGGVLRV